MEVPISFIRSQESKVDDLQIISKQHKIDNDEDAILMEVPISLTALEEVKTDVFENEMIPKNMHYVHTYTFEQRRQNWIIKNTSRPCGSIIDYVYHHIETNKKFRSLIEVYNFVVYGDIRETKRRLSQSNETLQVKPRHKPHIRVNKLIKHYVVGTCTESCKGVHIKNRRDVHYLFERGIPSNIEKKRKRENEDLYGLQQINLRNETTHMDSIDSALRTPIQPFFYLWDFELIHIKERPTKKVLVPDIVKLERKESAIDLLNLHKQILEAQRRSGVDEQLRLFLLRASMTEASSSSMQAGVGLISGVDVVMESQTLTTTPLDFEGNLEVSFSAPAITATTIHVLGETKASAPFTDSQA
ncbi:uncharacterized protein LOC125856914 [Solanum stenotomum]|uniref:uncharacterized protein LOC125856914 n=1 Tax=Solanum stenotomum TaxID=172797 RepID=UPI0020D1422B|nr:uncharacterized protein LOC125856914 [Solanum stenotomum]